MTMRKLMSILVISLAACGGSDPPPPISLSCSANTAMSTAPYEVKDDKLILGTAPNTQTLTRLAQGAAGRPVYGTWQLAKDSKAGLSIDAKLEVGADSITVSALCRYADGRMTSAKATSRAEITDTMIKVLQDMKQTVPFGIPAPAAKGS